MSQLAERRRSSLEAVTEFSTAGHSATSAERAASA
jgi:hypothetical protein